MNVSVELVALAKSNDHTFNQSFIATQTFPIWKVSMMTHHPHIVVRTFMVRLSCFLERSMSSQIKLNRTN